MSTPVLTATAPAIDRLLLQRVVAAQAGSLVDYQIDAWASCGAVAQRHSLHIALCADGLPRLEAAAAALIGLTCGQFVVLDSAVESAGEFARLIVLVAD